MTDGLIEWLKSQDFDRPDVFKNLRGMHVPLFPVTYSLCRE